MQKYKGVVMIGLIFINEINLCPYIDKYIEQIEKSGEDYRIIIWDRHYEEGKKYKYNNIEVYPLKAEETDGYIKKAMQFYKYSRFLKKHLKEKKYDKLIILSTLTGFLVYKQLKTTYSGKYIFDYRDASYEKIGFFKKMLAKIVDNSYFACISSDGFKRILPQKEYINSHNFKYSDLEKQQVIVGGKKEKITISYVGLLRGFEYHKNLLDIFGNDDRFIVKFHGNGECYEEIKQYSLNYNNVEITGWYDNDLKFKHNLDADMLFYNYPCSYRNNFALANRYYDGLFFKKPLIGNIDTFSGRLIEEKGVGISLSYNLSKEKYKNRIYEYYNNFDRDKFLDNANKEIKRIVDEDSKYVEKIKEFVNL